MMTARNFEALSDRFNVFNGNYSHTGPMKCIIIILYIFLGVNHME